MAERNNEIADGISLGGEVEDIANGVSLGGETGSEEKKSAEQPKAQDTTPEGDSRVDVREFYDTLVKPILDTMTGIGQEQAQQFSNSLKIGKIPATDIYRIAGLKVYQQTISEAEKKRITAWCDQWAKEAQRLGNKEQEKREALDFAIPEFKTLFMYPATYDDFRNSLSTVAWANLDALIKTTCNDKIVELEEICSIQDAAINLGLLDMSDGASREDFKKRLASEINSHGAKIDTIEEAFKRFYDEKKEKDSTLTIDTNFSRMELITEFQRLKMFHVKLYPEDSDKFNNLEDFMHTCGIFLKDKVKFFEEDYFNDFKKHVKLSQLQQSIYKGTKKLAMCKEYGFSDTDWQNFEQKHKIKPISDEELIKMNQRNGIIKNSLKVGAAVAGLLVMFIVFRFAFPNQYTYLVSKIAPDEEQKALNIARQKEKAELERKIALEKAEQDKALAEERAAREREKYEAEKRLEEEIRNKQPKTYTVGIGSQYNFHTLQEAVDASKDTDTIILSPGIYKSTANIGKRITITSSQGIISSIKSKYFASKDVPIIVLDKSRPSKITTDVKISGVVFTCNNSLSFSSFTNYLENSSTHDRRYNANISRSGLKWTRYTEDPVSANYHSLLTIAGNVDFDGVVFADSTQDGVALISGNQTFSGCHFVNTLNNALLVLGNSFAKITDSSITYSVCGSGIKAKENTSLEISNVEFKKCHTGIYSTGNTKGTATKVKFDTSTIAAIRSAENSNINFTDISISGSMLNGATGIAVDGSSKSSFTNLDVQKAYTGLVIAGKSNPTFENCKFTNISKYGVFFTENAGGIMKNAEIYGAKRGIIIEKKAAPLIANTKVHDNEEAGITFKGEAKGHLENVESYLNTTGFSINDNSYPVITRSKAYSNNTGFLSSENNMAKIVDSEAYKNNASGFAIYEDRSVNFKANNIIDGCKFYDNKWDGIALRGSVSVSIINTEATGNRAAAGLSLAENALVTVKNSCFTGNKYGVKALGRAALGAIKSTFNQNADSGAYLSGSTKANLLECTFDENRDGLYTDGSAYVAAEECSMSKNTNIGMTIRDKATGEYKNCLNHGNDGKNIENQSKADSKPTFDNSFMISIKNIF